MGSEGAGRTDHEEMVSLAAALKPAVEAIAEGIELAPDGRAFLAAIRRRESVHREVRTETATRNAGRGWFR
jgi:hypothetical protein